MGLTREGFSGPHHKFLEGPIDVLIHIQQPGKPYVTPKSHVWDGFATGGHGFSTGVDKSIASWC